MRFRTGRVKFGTCRVQSLTSRPELWTDRVVAHIAVAVLDLPGDFRTCGLVVATTGAGLLSTGRLQWVGRLEFRISGSSCSSLGFPGFRAPPCGQPAHSPGPWYGLQLHVARQPAHSEPSGLAARWNKASTCGPPSLGPWAPDPQPAVAAWAHSLAKGRNRGRCRGPALSDLQGHAQQGFRTFELPASGLPVYQAWHSDPLTWHPDLQP